MEIVRNTALDRENRTDEGTGPSAIDAEYEAPLNLLELFDDMEFPASLPELVDHALDKGASEEVLENIRAMPDRDYDSVEEINRYHNRIDLLPGQENIFSSEDAPEEELPTEIRDKPVIVQRR